MQRLLAAMISLMALFVLTIQAQEAPEKAPDETPAEKPAPSAVDAPEGKHKVAHVADLKLKDEARNKELAVAAWAPQEAGKYPVILYSVSGGLQAARPMAEYWASHGFVVLAPVHDQGRGDVNARVDQMFEQLDANKDGKLSGDEIPENLRGMLGAADTDGDGAITKDELRAVLSRMGGQRQPQPEQPAPPPAPPAPDKDKEKEEEFSVDLLQDQPAPPPPQPRGQRQPRGQQRNFGPMETTAAGADRVKDVALVLNGLETLAAHESLNGKLDSDRIAAAGVGFGAWTGLVASGATFDLDAEHKATNMADKRIKAVIAMSPPGIGHLGLTKDSFKELKLPMLTMTGSNDRNFRNPEQGPEWRRDAFAAAPEGSKYHVVIEGANAGNFMGVRGGMGRRGGQEGNPQPEQIQGWARGATLSFLNAHLKGDKTAAALLNAEAVTKASGEKVKLEAR